jgi:hypothetical protein
MKAFTLAIAALVSLEAAGCSSAAWAQTRTRSWRQEIERADDATTPRNLATRYVRNANACAPDQSRAVWGRGQVLLGYACYNEQGRR